MARVVYHLDLGIILYLKRKDLGHPNRPGLWEHLHADKAAQKPLRCWANEQIDTGCPGRMHLRLMPHPSGEGVIRQAVHHPRDVPGHVAAVESDQHKALKEHMATAADRAGFPVDVESRAADGRRRTDVLITGQGGFLLGAEAQISPLTAQTVRRRTEIAREHGVTPLWVSNDRKHQSINRAPWARIDNLSKDIYGSNASLNVRGGVYGVAIERCGRRDGTCPDKVYGGCGKFHPHFDLTLGVYLDRLIVEVAAQEMVNVPDGKNIRWVTAADRAALWDLNGGPPSQDEIEESEKRAGDAPTLFEDGPHSMACGYRTSSYERAPWIESREPAASSLIVPADPEALVEGQTWADHRRWQASTRCQVCRQPLITSTSQALGVCVRCSYA